MKYHSRDCCQVRPLIWSMHSSCLCCSVTSKSSRNFWLLKMQLWYLTLLTWFWWMWYLFVCRNKMAATKVIFPGCLWSSGPLTILYITPKCQFQLCFWQWQKHWVCCINSEREYFEEATAVNNEVKCTFHYWKRSRTFGYALACQEKFSLCNKSQGKGVNTFLSSVYKAIKHTIKCT